MFSVPRCRFASDGIFDRLQLLCFFFLTPDTRHLKPPKQVAIFTGKAIELLPGPKREVFDSEVKPVPA